MAIKRDNIEKIIQDSKILIENSLNDEMIMSLINNYSYTNENLEEGKKLLDDFISKLNEQKTYYSKKYQATKNIDKYKKEANEVYLSTFNISKVLFKDNIEAENQLELKGSRKKAFDKWLLQTTTFYKNLLNNEEFLTILSNHGYNKEKLISEKSLIEKVSNEKLNHEKFKGLAQNATKEKQAKLKELKKWISKYKKIARIALENNPQLLEKIGIFVKS